jgi:hypothetical protein
LPGGGAGRSGHSDGRGGRRCRVRASANVLLTSFSRRMLFRAFTWVVVMLVAPACVAQEVTIRVVNAANGDPLTKARVFVRDMGAARHDLRLETDGKGEARFTLPDSAPPHIRVDVYVSRTRWECGCFAEGYTADVIQTGVVATPAVHGQPTAGATALKVKPGQILLALRSLSFSERLHMFFVGA